jgi:hypothetical protein
VTNRTNPLITKRPNHFLRLQKTETLVDNTTSQWEMQSPEPLLECKTRIRNTRGVHSVTTGNFDKSLRFLPIFIAQKLNTGLVNWHRTFNIMGMIYEACPESKFQLAVNGYKDNILNISLFLQVYMFLATSRHNHHPNWDICHIRAQVSVSPHRRSLPPTFWPNAAWLSSPHHRCWIILPLKISQTWWIFFSNLLIHLVKEISSD